MRTSFFRKRLRLSLISYASKNVPSLPSRKQPRNWSVLRASFMLMTGSRPPCVFPKKTLQSKRRKPSFAKHCIELKTKSAKELRLRRNVEGLKRNGRRRERKVTRRRPWKTSLAPASRNSQGSAPKRNSWKVLFQKRRRKRKHLNRRSSM